MQLKNIFAVKIYYCMYEYYITNTTAIKKYKWDVCIMFGDFGHFEMPRTVSLKLLTEAV